MVLNPSDLFAAFYFVLIVACALGVAACIVVMLRAHRESQIAPFSFQRDAARMRFRRAGFLAVFLVVLSIVIWGTGRAAGPTIRGVATDFARDMVTDFAARFIPPPTATPTTTPSPTPAPPSPTPVPTQTPSPTLTATPVPPTVTPSPSPSPTATTVRILGPFAEVPTPVVTDEEPAIGAFVFSREITEGGEPIKSQVRFNAGPGPIHAVFRFANMRNGMAWSHAWYRDGQEIIRGEDTWQWGTDGRAWLYFNPVGGFSPGTYELRFYVEGELRQSGGFVVE